METKQNMSKVESKGSANKAPGGSHSPLGPLKIESADSNYKPGDNMGVAIPAVKERSMEPQKA